MSKPMKMRCTVAEDADCPWMYRINAVMFDGTPFSFKTERHNVDLTDNITSDDPVVQGWVFVTHVAQQGGQVFINLPSPTIEYGKNVNVEEHTLMPLGVTISNFKINTI